MFTIASRAMRVITTLWPEGVIMGSGFATETPVGSISTYVVARILLLEALSWLSASGRVAEHDEAAVHGAHLLLLRPALVSTAKCAWMLRSDEGGERTTRALRLIMEDRRQGVVAMNKAVERGAHEAFSGVAEFFERARDAVRSAAGRMPEIEQRPPRDEELITELGRDIDRYYGGNVGRSDLQLLWNAASSLSHGERWYTWLADAGQREELAKRMTSRSIDAVCSAINVTHLRVVSLAVPVVEQP